MAASIASLNINVVAQTAAFVRGMKQAEAELGRFGAAVQSLKSRLVSISLGAAGAAASFITIGKAVEQVSIGVQLAAEAEQAQVAFSTMLRSADDATKMLGDLQQLALDTPFRTDNLRDAAKRLLAFKFEGEQVIPLLRMMGDISSGTGKDIGELATIFGQVKLATKLTGMELMQFTNAGIPLLAELAEMLGKSEVAVKDMVSKGAISFEMVQQAMQKMTREGGLFFNLMDKQSKTLAGRWSAFNESLDIIRKSIGGLVVEGLNLKGMLDDADSTASRFAQALKESAPEIKQVLSELSTAISEIGQALTGTTNNVDAMKQGFSAMAVVVRDLAKQLKAAAFYVKLITGAKEFIENSAIAIRTGQSIQSVEQQRAALQEARDKLRRGVGAPSESAAGGGGAIPEARGGNRVDPYLEQLEQAVDGLMKSAESARPAMEKLKDQQRQLTEAYNYGVITEAKFNEGLQHLRKEMEKHDEGLKRVRDIYKQTRTPLEIRLEKEKELVKLFKDGKFGNDIETFRRAMDEVAREFMANDPAAKAMQDRMKAAQESAKQRQEELKQRAADVRESIKTPAQKFKDELAKLIELGPMTQQLTPEEFNKARQNLFDQFKEELTPTVADVGSPAAIEAGSAAAFTAINQAIRENERGREQQKLQQKANDLLKNIEQAIYKEKPGFVPRLGGA